MPVVSSHFRSEALKESGSELLTRIIRYKNVNYWGHILGMDSIKINAEDFIVPDYSVEIQNRDLSLSWLVLSRWSGQTMEAKFGFWDGSSAHTITLFKGIGKELFADGERITINAEGKFAYLSREKWGASNSPVSFANTSWNPADLFWTVAESYSQLNSSKDISNPDINYTSWGSWHHAMEIIGLQVQAQLENKSIQEFIREIAKITGAWIFENEGKLDFNYFVPQIPGTVTVNTIDQDYYDPHPKIKLIDIANTIRVFHGFEPSSKVWTGEALEVNSTSVGSYGQIIEQYDNEIVWHSNSRSADQFARRVLLARDSGNVEVEISGDLPLWIFNIGDRVHLNVSSFNINGAYAVKEYERNPEDRKSSLGLEGTESWDGAFFFLDYDSSSGGYGLLDESDNPIY